MAMVPNNYSVNIAVRSKDYAGKPWVKHYALVELGQCTYDEAWDKYEDIASRFPPYQGFEVTLRQVSCEGRDIATSKG